MSSIAPISAPSPRALAAFESAAAPASPARPGNSPAEVRRAAEQFEAIMLRQLVAPAIEPMMNGSLAGGGGAGGGVYGFMLTDVLANAMSQGGGLGLASVLEKQLTPPTGTDSSVIP